MEIFIIRQSKQKTDIRHKTESQVYFYFNIITKPLGVPINRLLGCLVFLKMRSLMSCSLH